MQLAFQRSGLDQRTGGTPETHLPASVLHPFLPPPPSLSLSGQQQPPATGAGALEKGLSQSRVLFRVHRQANSEINAGAKSEQDAEEMGEGPRFCWGGDSAGPPS